MLDRLKRAFLIVFGMAMLASAGQAMAQKQAAKNQWLGIITLARPELFDPSRWTKEEGEIVSSHFAYWQRLTKEGVAILVGRTQDVDSQGHMAKDGLGLAIFEAPSREEAEAIMAADPAVKGKIFNARVASYYVALQR